MSDTTRRSFLAMGAAALAAPALPFTPAEETIFTLRLTGHAAPSCTSEVGSVWYCTWDKAMGDLRKTTTPPKGEHT